MNRERLGIFLIVLLVALPLLAAVRVGAIAPSNSPDAPPAPPATPSGRVATQAELEAARAEWAASAHADTYDEGMGANTTCARCKAPRNWDPSQEIAQQMALDCGSCKREPGAPRPELAEGVRVPKDEWKNISCDVCHIPVGDSYDTDVAFWNQASGQYETVENIDDLCGHCHEGRHGFHVIEEQAASDVHRGMACTDCHGAHGKAVACSDCHDPTVGDGAHEHARHPGVSCSGCHDAGGLSVWQDPDPASDHYSAFITRRFAHTLTSWPSHNLALEVDCVRCHHPQGDREPALVPEVSCTECHDHPYGAVSEWCIYFERDRNPDATATPTPPAP